ncbi:MAG: hypothetical protein AB4062_07870 [Crocosphaera sp.]
MNQYFIHDLKKNYCVQINDREVEQLKNAKNNLFFAFVLEEKLEFILMNYADIEKEAFNMTLSQMMTDDYDWNRSRDLTNIVNLKVFNLLSTHQFYIDTVESTFNSFYGKNCDEYKMIQSKQSEEYDHNLSYRTICAMRNHVQHYELPIHTITLNQELVENHDGKKSKCHLKLGTKITSLERNKKFKKKILNDLRETFGENIDLMFIIKNYLDSIGNIHQEIRKILKPNLEEWDKIMMNTIDNDPIKYKQYIEHGGLYIIKNLNLNDHRINISDCFKYIERRKNFEKKYRYLKNYSRQFITQEIVEE